MSQRIVEKNVELYALIFNRELTGAKPVLHFRDDEDKQMQYKGSYGNR